MLTTDLEKLDTSVLSSLVVQGAGAVQEGLAKIASMERLLTEKNQKIAELQQAGKAGKQGEDVLIQAEQAAKFAGLLVQHRIISPADKVAATEKLRTEPKKMVEVMDKLSSLIPAPTAPADGEVVRRTSQFAAAASAPKEQWY